MIGCSENIVSPDSRPAELSESVVFYNKRGEVIRVSGSSPPSPSLAIHSDVTSGSSMSDAEYRRTLRQMRDHFRKIPEHSGRLRAYKERQLQIIDVLAYRTRAGFVKNASKLPVERVSPDFSQDY